MIQAISSTASSDLATSSAQPEPAEPKAAPIHAAGTEPDVRLSIEASSEGPYFVYTLQDRATGRIIAQLPRESVKALGDSPDYQAGDFIRSQA